MFLLETIVSQGRILESDSTKLPKGVLSRGEWLICNLNSQNQNHRVYEKAVWDKVMNDDNVKRKMESRTLFGQAEHPEKTQSDLQLTSHIITGMSVRENQVYQNIDILDTPCGRIVNTLMEAGCQVGVSTRAEGDLEEVKEGDNVYQRVVPESYNYCTTDFTADPSTYGTVPLKVESNLVKEIVSGYKKGTDGKQHISKQYAISLLESMQSDEAKEALKDINEFEDEGDDEYTEPEEPEEGDITTEDHEHWYQHGKLYYTGDTKGLKKKMAQDKYWPDVWFISDHGNAHLIKNLGKSTLQVNSIVTLKDYNMTGKVAEIKENAVTIQMDNGLIITMDTTQINGDNVQIQLPQAPIISPEAPVTNDIPHDEETKTPEEEEAEEDLGLEDDEEPVDGEEEDEDEEFESKTNENNFFKRKRIEEKNTGDYLIDYDLFGQELQKVLPKKLYIKLSKLVKQQDMLINKSEESEAVTNWMESGGLLHDLDDFIQSEEDLGSFLDEHGEERDNKLYDIVREINSILKQIKTFESKTFDNRKDCDKWMKENKDIKILKINKLAEGKLGVDYMRSAKASMKKASQALKDKDYEEAAKHLEDVADDAADAAKAAKKIKRDGDAKAEADKNKEGEEKVEKEKDDIEEESTPKMMPGQKPYTEEEQKKLDKLKSAALDAEDEFSQGELEDYAKKHRKDERVRTKKVKEKKVTESKTNESYEELVNYIEQKLKEAKPEDIKKFGNVVKTKILKESISQTAKQIRELQIKEASTRAEKDKAIELLEETESKLTQAATNVSLETKILTEKLSKTKLTEANVNALCIKLEERTKKINELKTEVKIASGKIKELTEKYEKDKQEYVDLSIKELEETKKNLEENSKKQLIKEYITLKLKHSGLKIHKSSQTLLERCTSVEGVDEVFEEVRDAMRRDALHPGQITDVQITESKEDSGLASFANSVRNVISAM